VFLSRLCENTQQFYVQKNQDEEFENLMQQDCHEIEFLCLFTK